MLKGLDKDKERGAEGDEWLGFTREGTQKTWKIAVVEESI